MKLRNLAILALLAAPVAAQTPAPQPSVAVAPAPPSDVSKTPEPVVEPPLPAELPFSWGNMLPSYVRRGVDSYAKDQFGNAEQDFQSARLLNPEVPAPTFNMGLTAAKKGKADEAASYFDSAADLAREDTDLKARALYNKGVVRFEQARKALEEKKDKVAAINDAIEALDSFAKASELSSTLEDAPHNRALVQDFLRKLPVEPEQPPQQQPQKNDDQQKKDDQQKDQQQDGGGQSDQQQQQPDQGKSEGEQQQDPKDGDQQEQQNQESGKQEQPRQEKKEQPKQGEGQPQPAEQKPEGKDDKPQDGQPHEMTPEEAKQLLNMIEKGEQISLSKGKNPKADPKRKPW